MPRSRRSSPRTFFGSSIWVDPVAAGTQELVLPDVPNVIVYRVRGERVDFEKLVGRAA